MKGYLKLRKKGFEILNEKLSKKLSYHSIYHTFAVLQVVNQYIKREKINTYDAKLLRIGALFHDIGFTESSENHEEISVSIAKKYMKNYGFSKEDIAIVQGLILATRIPQTPKTHLEKIICDADLDYLGKANYYEISESLFKELLVNSVKFTKKEWNAVQIRFLEDHKFHTDFAQKNRQPHKEKRISELKKKVF